MPDKQRIGVRLPDTLLADLKICMKKQGYSARKKSFWVQEALIRYLSQGADKIAESQLFVGDKISPANVSDMITLPDDLYSDVQSMIFELKKKNPFLEDLQSLLIRAAIRNRVGSNM